MSVTTITAARIYQGQLKNKTGEEEKLFFETFPYVGLSKVIKPIINYRTINFNAFAVIK